MHAALSGLLLHGCYLGGVFWSLSHGMPATIAALIASLQPLLIALCAGPLLAETITALQWAGILLGFVGAVMVIGFDIGGAIPAITLLICSAALITSVIGTLYQKRFGQDLPLVPANIIQALAATMFHMMMLMMIETPFVNLTNTYLLGMTWQVLVVSFGAYVMFLVLLQRGTANQTSSLLFLVAPVAALQAWFVLGEHITKLDIAGLCFASIGVYLATRKTA